ncbi:hypothetical protein CEXT_535781 [Caerostris extrusa]|uniref:Uncharacterized protein n=1 Tax=Caerostris extrusa TaxID=172846 RepID=A0AAV4W0V9_CAEEX|nr:hypothetical protein CEXT_535781 [Caerostris extrusa]
MTSVGPFASRRTIPGATPSNYILPEKRLLHSIPGVSADVTCLGVAAFPLSKACDSGVHRSFREIPRSEWGTIEFCSRPKDVEWRLHPAERTRFRELGHLHRAHVGIT